MSKELEVNAPKVIYLQIGDDHEGEYSDEATWCADKIHNTDIAYVLRSDYDELAAKLAEAERQLAELKGRVEDLLINLEAKHECLQQAHSRKEELKAKLTEAERLNKVALEAIRRLMLCDMAEVRTIKGSSGAIDNARNAIKELELK